MFKIFLRIATNGFPSGLQLFFRPCKRAFNCTFPTHIKGLSSVFTHIWLKYFCNLPVYVYLKEAFLMRSNNPLLERLRNTQPSGIIFRRFHVTAMLTDSEEGPLSNLKLLSSLSKIWNFTQIYLQSLFQAQHLTISQLFSCKTKNSSEIFSNLTTAFIIVC
jgi:hypothetical protein